VRTEPRASRLAEDGFTLIEVLVAMVILSVGLLGLEALGIGVAKSLGRAERQNTMAANAVGAMERAQHRIRLAPGAVTTGNSCGSDADSGMYVCTDVQTWASLGTIPRRTARVMVSVSRSVGSTDSYSVTSYVFDPALP
jgi:prepilin-type N-terminal cleavage/methylation domain-containing protein